MLPVVRFFGGAYPVQSAQLFGVLSALFFGGLLFPVGDVPILLADAR